MWDDVSQYDIDMRQAQGNVFFVYLCFKCTYISIGQVVNTVNEHFIAWRILHSDSEALNKR